MYSTIPFLRQVFLAAVLPLSLTALAQQNKPSQSQTSVPTNTAIVLTPGGYTTTSQNFVRVWEPLAPYSDANAVTTAPHTHVRQSTQYFDGLGRPLQTVQKQASTTAKDIVAAVYYDHFGRESHQFLPYVAGSGDGLFKTSPFSEQKTFYQSSKDASGQNMYSGEQVFYGQSEFEASPLNRSVKSMAPGNSWAGNGKGVEQSYLVNTAAEGVRIWNIASNNLTYGADKDATTNIPISPAAYNTGELYKNVTLDENKNVSLNEQGKAVVEYKDKEGRVVLKKVQVGTSVPADFSGYEGFLCTYYIYDDLGQLRFVLPPKAVEAILGTWSLQGKGEVIQELCFRYEYDSRGRMKAKKVPGSGWVYMVYDVRDRLVFTQDENMRSKGQWLATFYDVLNRPVMTGMMSGWSGNAASLQESVTTSSSLPPSGNTSLQADLVLDQPNASGIKEALRSITLEVGFSAEGGEFTAQIATGAGGPDGESYVVDDMVVNKKTLPDGASFVALTKTFYDDYSWTNTTFTTAYNTYLSDVGGSLHAEALPTAASKGTRGMVTGTKVRVLEDVNNLASGKWLSTATFYDEKGRTVQVHAENYSGGLDIATSRYDFSGKVLASYLHHRNPQSTTAETRVLTKTLYDHGGRVLKVLKQLNNSGADKLVAENSYDELGQLVRKTLAPGYSSGTGLQKLDYTYNIRGWLKGVNSGYVKGASTQSDRYFGMELSYDWGFEQNQYNGNISGVRWKSKGDGEERAYGFGYDAANRLLFADFNQKFGSAWEKTDPANTSYKIDFSVKMGNGLSAADAYDANGNIKMMEQWGLKGLTSDKIDALAYNYKKDNSGNGYSNKLYRVSDSAPAHAFKLGDIKDGANTGDDYDYDGNGNLVVDRNKDITSIVYNHLNLPAVVNTAKGTITYTYDAAGNKLQKRVEEAASAANNNQPKSTVTTYLGGFVYENVNNGGSTLQFLSHEEGRVRPVSGQTSSFAFDYFLKDHLGNVRMVLTEEQKQDQYPAATLEGTYNASTPEVVSMINHEKKFYTINSTYVVNSSTMPGWTSAKDYQNNNGNPPYNLSYPSGTAPNATDVSAKVYKLNATTNKTGLGIVLKVMAGDKIDIHGKSYYQSTTTYNNTNSTLLTLANIVSAFIVSPDNAGFIAKGVTTSGMQTLNTGLIPNTFFRGNDNSSSTVPKAYINYLFFDEQFKYAGGNFSRVGASGVVKNHWFSDPQLQNIAVPKNGYLYVYVSNESNANVFFDNLQVFHTRGPILEETHYYPFGLTMAGISSKAAGGLVNKKKWNKGSELQNEEFSDGSGLEMYATPLRSLDPQLGRWWQIDPKPDYAQSLYASMGNNPILFNDPLGDTVKIRHGGFLGIGRKTTIYEDGKLYNKDGKTAYAGKVKGFLAKTTAALDKIRTGGPTGKELVGTLQKSTENFNIVRGANGFNEQKGKLTNVISWSPANNSGGPDVSGSTRRPSFIGLAHELGHGYDLAVDGRIDYTNWSEVNRPMGEIFASHWENMVRAEHGVNLRSHYGIDETTSPRTFTGALLVPGTTLSRFFYRGSTIDIDGVTHDLDIPYDYVTDKGKFGYQR